MLANHAHLPGPLAALRHNIKTIIVPHKNAKDLEDVPKELRKKCKFHLAKELTDVLKHALVHDPIEWAKQLKVAREKEEKALAAMTGAAPRSAKNVERAA